MVKGVNGCDRYVREKSRRDASFIATSFVFYFHYAFYTSWIKLLKMQRETIKDASHNFQITISNRIIK